MELSGFSSLFELASFVVNRNYVVLYSKHMKIKFITAFILLTVGVMFYAATSSAQLFTLSITSLSPSSGSVGTAVVITGTGFTKTGNSIKFGDSFIKEYNYITSNFSGPQLQFTVPATNYLECWNSVPACATPALMTQPGEYRVYVTNANGTSNSLTFTVTRVVITTTSLPSGQVGTPYSASISASGGSDSYSWRVASGALPPGLSLIQGVCIAIVGPCQAPVEISGTPTTAGTHTFTVEVTSGKEVASRQFTISVETDSEVTAPLVITTTSLPSGKVGTKYSTTISASGGSDSYVWSIISGSLPKGLTLYQPVCITWPCKVSAEISGSPTISGTYTFTVQVVSGKEVASKQWALKIKNAKFYIGGRVMVTANKLKIRATPAGKTIGSQILNAQGTIIGGPITKNGHTWWNIDYDTGADGWSAQNYLAPLATVAGDFTVGDTPFSQTLSVGSTGQEVSTLQSFLKKLGFYQNQITGYFGTITKASVINFQSANALDAVGIVGPKTRALLLQMMGQ